MSEAEKHRVRRAALGLLSAGAAAGAGCLSWALHEAHRYILRERVLVLPHVANAAGELRILHLSDMHLLRRHRAKQQFLRELGQRCRPDLVVLTGDHLSEAGAVGPLLDALAPLADIPGLFVYGSNDYFAPVLKNPLRYVAPGLFPPLVEKGEPDLPWEEMTAGLEAFGWIDLNNQRARLRAALAAGTDVVKVFPAASAGGPGHVKALRSVFPQVTFCPTGGIDSRNAPDYLAAGAAFVGMGGKLVDESLIAKGDRAAVQDAARAALGTGILTAGPIEKPGIVTQRKITIRGQSTESRHGQLPAVGMSRQRQSCAVVH